MGAWGPTIFSDDMALDIRREYSILLSAGNDNATVEKMLMDYYSDIFNCNDPDEDVFWFVLALCEWKKGRLSPFVKEKALSALESGRDLERWNTKGNEKDYKKRQKVLGELRDVILSPMPAAKKIKKTTVHHCPWKEGSLLAYRIVTAESVKSHPCYMQYVLLRVLKIKKHPVSRLFDTGYYDESMLVGLYDWIGSEIPNPEIADSLCYIPIEEGAISKPTGIMDLSQLDGLSAPAKEKITNGITDLFKEKSLKSVWLDWLPTGECKGDITYLGCDEDFGSHIPAFFESKLYSNTYTHFWPFDVTLSKRFEARFEKH